MKRKYAKGGIFREGMDVPSPDEGAPPKPAAKPSKPAAKPADEGVFKAEMLQKSGGKMKNPPTDPEVAPSKYAGGGVTRGDGCAARGKTKGRMV